VTPVPAFTTTVQRTPGRTVVSLIGELDLASTDELHRTALDELRRGECSQLVLDLGGVTFVDSTGIGTWIELRSEAERAGKSLRLEHPTPLVTRVLRIAGLLDFFELEAD